MPYQGADTVGDIVPRISEVLPKLRRSERKVAEMIRADLSSAAELSIDRLAENAKVSKATVTRFARAVGCRDVRALKLALARAAAVGNRFLSQDDVPISAQSGSKDRIYADILHTLAINASLCSAETYRHAAEILANAEMIYAFGVGGGSTVMADEACFRLMRLGCRVTSYHDPVLQRMVAATMHVKDAVLAFSVSGLVPEMLASCQIAREYGARLVAVTDPDSKLAAMADCLIPVQSFEDDLIYSPSTSRYALMMSLDMIATEIALRHPAESQEKLRRIKFTLDAHRGGDKRHPLGD
jgi:RpiR family transcriptional regulator, carbohydrate utilization regulator